MPRRGEKPGHKIGRHGLRYWIAKNVVRDIKSFPDKCIALPIGATDEEVSALCHEHTARLLAWLDNPEAIREEPALAAYDGTVKALCRIYRSHPHSPLHRVKQTNTRRFYEAYLDLIELTVGKRLVRNVDVFTCQHWHDQWRKPVVSRDDKGNEITGPDRLDRAHDAISMFRTVVNFCSKLRRFAGRKECKELASDLAKFKFEKGGAREQEMTLEYARAFIDKAMEFRAKGIFPAARALCLAIGVAAQFELMLRQKDIIGEWTPKTKLPRLPKGATVQDIGPEIWWGFFTWESVAGWRWRMKTSKSKYRSAADFNLARYSLLMPLLEDVPLHERSGVIVKGEHGLPVRESSYRQWYRQVARAAGIPDEVWLMDSRAGGASEAKAARAPLGAISGALTHADEKTTLRYLRRSAATADHDIVADARAAKREADEAKGG